MTEWKERGGGACVPVDIDVIEELVDLSVDDLEHALLGILAQGVEHRPTQR